MLLAVVLVGASSVSCSKKDEPIKSETKKKGEGDKPDTEHLMPFPNSQFGISSSELQRIEDARVPKLGRYKKFNKQVSPDEVIIYSYTWVGKDKKDQTPLELDYTYMYLLENDRLKGWSIVVPYPSAQMAVLMAFAGINFEKLRGDSPIFGMSYRSKDGKMNITLSVHKDNCFLVGSPNK